METIDSLKVIADELRKSPKIEAVFLEYPAYLSVVIDEAKETIVDFGFSFDYDEMTDMQKMRWNTPDGGISDEFNSLATASGNADMLIAQLEKAGLL